MSQVLGHKTGVIVDKIFTIDRFQDGIVDLHTRYWLDTGGGPENGKVQPAADCYVPAPLVPGRIRRMFLRLVDGPANEMSRLQVTSGALSHLNDPNTYSTCQLGYGLDPADKLPSLHLDLSPYRAFRLFFNSNNLSVNINSQLFSGGGAFHVSAGVNISPNTAEAALQFSDFKSGLPGFTWNDVDLVTFEFQVANNGRVGSNFELAEIQAIS